jgi:hypothetical protein
VSPGDSSIPLWGRITTLRCQDQINSPHRAGKETYYSLRLLSLPTSTVTITSGSLASSPLRFEALAGASSNDRECLGEKSFSYH